MSPSETGQEEPREEFWSRASGDSATLLVRLAQFRRNKAIK
jgi:hypothetical protein